MVLSRPSTRTGSPDSGWWGTEEAKQLQRAARKQIVAGDYAAAERIFAQAIPAAKKRGDRISTARLISGVAGTRMARFDFEGALSAYLDAKHYAEISADWLDIGVIDINLSNLYEQVWDLGAALRAAEESRSAARKTGVSYQAVPLLQIGRLHAERRDEDPNPFFTAAVDAARREEQLSVEAAAWTQIGYERLSRGAPHDAEEAFLQAYCLRRDYMPRDLGQSYFDLASARVAAAENAASRQLRSSLLDEAETLFEQAAERYRRGGINIPPFQLQQLAGRILLLRGDVAGALKELSAAIDSARQRRNG